MKPDFSRYKAVIKESLQQKRSLQNDRSFSKSLSAASIGAVDRRPSPARKLTLNDPITDHEFFESLHALTGITGKEPKYNEAPGLHPDFSAIKETGIVEYHWIVSMFVDIRRSTRLFAKYEPFVVANITTTIQHAAIHIAWYFDGYVQRYHGDGLLLYFGGKGGSPQKAITNAILTASVFTKFVKEELPEIFQEQGVDNIYTRIGIDVGENVETLWHLAGMEKSSEVTTCCLHTSLAAHMQGAARANGIMMGDNVKIGSGLDPALFNILKDSSGKVERYCFSNPDENYYYTQWNFEWAEHLKKVEAETNAKNAVAMASVGAQPKQSNNGENIAYLRQQAATIKPYSE